MHTNSAFFTFVVYMQTFYQIILTVDIFIRLLNVKYLSILIKCINMIRILSGIDICVCSVYLLHTEVRTILIYVIIP